MFTGIIEEVGTIKNIKKGIHSATLEIFAKTVTSDLALGDSVAVNGVCLTVTAFSSSGFSADVMHETLNRSSLSALKSGSRVNLERAMAANGRFGGHIVSGHVNGVGTIVKKIKDDIAIRYTFKTSPDVMRYIIEKGSVAIDGISLTVTNESADRFSVSIIPHTLGATILSEKGEGDIVNIETDIIGKYVEKFLLPSSKQEKKSELTMEFLIQNGF
ncbi:MAG: riboflavin synthase [Firmicutes bacterium]|nr:riboflavin synthase [Bacillota bacterium]